MKNSKTAVHNANGISPTATAHPRIIGRFMKQTWGGRKGDYAIPCGHEDFDATDHILLMKPDAIRALVDGSENTDVIGCAHVSWDGPHEVAITDSIRYFFGVDDLEEITDEAIAEANHRLSPQPAIEQIVTLEIKVKVRVAPGASVGEFIENLNYSVTSNTVGITVNDTEIVDAD